MKTVLITGASSGIGKATALLFQKKGWNVAATMRNPDKETELKKLDHVGCYRIDVIDRTSIADAIAAILADFGSIDAVVNNAGMYTTKPLEMTSDDEIGRIIDTNITGTVNMIKMIVPVFRDKKSGTIVNLSSVAGKIAFPYQGIYCASKWAIEGLTESLYYEMRSVNIRIKMVEPGVVKTNLYDSVKEMATDEYPTDYREPFLRWYRFLAQKYSNGYDPALEAATIFRAVTDTSQKLRYTTDFTTKALFTTRRFLPFVLFKGILSILCRK